MEDNGNKCGKCQNHDFEVLKKGHARECPFKKCDCLKCRLLDARSDILQVISGKETKLKGTKKDPNCGFCQNHGVKILRKGHVRSCHFGQERHFKLDNCFDCEVHYIRNEVNRLQIKMRRAMKEDRMLSEEQRKTAREPITRAEVEKVCDMAKLAREKRERLLAQQAAAGGPSSAGAAIQHQASPPSVIVHSHHHNGHHQKVEHSTTATSRHHPYHQLNHLSRGRHQANVWRPWSQHQVAAAMAAQHQQQQQQQQQHHHLNNHHQAAPQPHPTHLQLQQLVNSNPSNPVHLTNHHYQNQLGRRQQQQQQAMLVANLNLQHSQQLMMNQETVATNHQNQRLINMLPAHSATTQRLVQPADQHSPAENQNYSGNNNTLPAPSTNSPTQLNNTEQFLEQQQALDQQQQQRDLQQQHLALAFLRAIFMAQAAQHKAT